MQLSARMGWTGMALGGLVTAIVACSSAAPNVGFAEASGGTAFAGPDIATPPSGAKVSPLGTCPVNSPSQDQSCGPNQGSCEYGSSDDPACNTVARCDQSTGTWNVDQGTHCPSSCPQHFDEHAPGASCGGTALCTYLEATCGCAGAIDGAWTTITGGSNNVPDGGGDGGDEAGTDGGAGQAAIGQWQCVRPGYGCPARRPLEGTPCTTAKDCDYGTCVFGVPLSLTCINGVWTDVLVGSCP